MKNKILFVHQERNDGISLVDNEQISRLKTHTKNPFDFCKIRKKGNGFFQIFWGYFCNTFQLLKTSFSYKKIYFSYENPYILILKICYPWKQFFMCVHHLEKWADSFIGKKILASCTKIITISHFTKTQILEKGINETKIFVNYNGISNEYFCEKIENFYKNPYILYVGTEAPRKNLSTLFEVFANFHEKNPHIFLVKIGESGSEENHKNTEKIVENFPSIRENILFLQEKIPTEQLRKWYSNAIFYISLSNLEGFGLTVGEALRCECPIIASNIPPFQEICQNTQILVDTTQISTIIEAMNTLANNPKIQYTNGKLGKKVSEKFSWENNIQNLISFFENK